MTVIEKIELPVRAQINVALLGDVEVVLEARLGETQLTVGELTSLEPGSLLTLDRSLADHADIYLNGKIVARGEIVAVDKNFGVRITEIAQQ